jgi:hypothetical protein
MTVSGPVREIRLYYTQGVVTAFSHVHVVNDAGAVIPTGKLVNDPSDQQTVIVRLGRALGPNCSYASDRLRHIGIDYSGAQTPTASLIGGLRIYLAEGDAPPAEVPPPPDG